jgi:large subunit ribosomal protein L3
MSLGLVGRKVGMTRVFTDDGATIPVTVVDVSNNRVTQIKTAETDGYSAVQVAYGRRRANRVNKAAAGHFSKASVEAGRILKEFRVKPDEAASLKVGGAVGADIFKPGQLVDVSGTTQGKGFSGVIKRHHFSSNRASHGNSVSHNKPGSIGQNQDPGRVFPGKRMAGHLGAAHRTVQNLEIVRVDAERQLLLIRGALPGSRGGDVTVKPRGRAARAVAPAAAAKPAAKGEKK